MSSENPIKNQNLSLVERGCTCRKNPDGTLFMFNRHTKDDCSFVREEQLRRERAYRKQGW